MKTGIISRFGGRGYGFIRPTDESPDVFFHVKDCFLRNHYLQVGDRVEFEINIFSRRELPRACEVRVVPNAQFTTGKDGRPCAEQARVLT